MSSLNEAARQDELPKSAPSSPRTRKSLGANDTGKSSGSKASSDKQGRICTADGEPLADGMQPTSVMREVLFLDTLQ